MAKFMVNYSVAMVLIVIVVAYFVVTQPFSMNVYEYGSKPRWETMIPVDENFEYQIGDYGRVIDATVESDYAFSTAELKSSAEFVREWKKHLLEEGGAELIYCRVVRNITLYGGPVDRYKATYTVKEAVFKGSPVDPLTILACLLLIAFIIGVIVGAVGFYLLTGVSPMSLIVPTISTVLILGMVAVIGFIGLCFVNPKLSKKILGIFKLQGVNKT